MNQPPQGYGPPPAGYGPPGPVFAPPQAYAPPGQAAHDPTKITPTDIILPLLLSVFCAVGGFGWGLVRMMQGHHKPGWVAMGINAAVWVLGMLFWLVIFVIGAASAGATAPAP